jgi:hypothetical protein
LLSSAILVAVSAASAVARAATVTEMYEVLKEKPYTLVWDKAYKVRNKNKDTLRLDKHTTLRDAGKLCAAQKCYEIGVWEWIDRHRAQRIMVFEIDRHSLIYLGGYGINTTEPFVIEGSKIVFSLPKEWGYEIEFGPDGPPAKTWIDGENPSLFK